MDRSTLEHYFKQPFTELLRQAQEVHHKHHDNTALELAAAISVKTGGCSENCGYCPQSAHSKTFVERQKPLSKEAILESAKKAQANGAGRVCFGAAWGYVPDGEAFENLLEAMRSVQELGLSVCGSLGMLCESQAQRLLKAGCAEYNCNIDSSERFYPNIITTRSYEERLESIRLIQEQGLKLCCGGILCMGETDEDVVDFIHTLVSLDPKPHSVPVNLLVPVRGTPVGDSAPEMDPIRLVRAIAVLRIVLPEAVIGLAAGRQQLSEAEQALCFCAGANKIWIGEKILTTSLPALDTDYAMLNRLALNPR